MAETPSTMVPLGTPAIDFSLKSANDGSVVSLHDFADSPVLVIIFMCNHCPFVKHLQKGLVDFHRDYFPKGVAMVGINSNNAETHPEDSYEKMVEEVKLAGYEFPYLHDEMQDVAKAYNAACTPDFFVFDRDRLLVYRGQFDDSRPGNDKPVTGKDLRAAVNALLNGESPSPDQQPSIGCNIKWKPGNAPGERE